MRRYNKDEGSGGGLGMAVIFLTSPFMIITLASSLSIWQKGLVFLLVLMLICSAIIYGNNNERRGKEYYNDLDFKQPFTGSSCGGGYWISKRRNIMDVDKLQKEADDMGIPLEWLIQATLEGEGEKPSPIMKSSKGIKSSNKKTWYFYRNSV